ncbi:MAG: MqnA/MqnD/SBP family protein, partial [Halobacteria archaeon]|nr:MqnA/MqnD/SBP family protein [Halobacteria archaeon]
EAAHDLEESKHVGYDNLGEIAEELSERMEIPKGYAIRYLKMLDHDFTPEHERGLMKYYEYAERIGVIEEVPDLRRLKI